jgi:hypothetical protein
MSDQKDSCDGGRAARSGDFSLSDLTLAARSLSGNAKLSEFSRALQENSRQDHLRRRRWTTVLESEAFVTKSHTMASLWNGSAVYRKKD